MPCSVLCRSGVGSRLGHRVLFRGQALKNLIEGHVVTGLLVIIPVGLARTERDARLPQLLGSHVSPLIAMGFIGVDVVSSPLAGRCR